jgi:hypothetical protein
MLTAVKPATTASKCFAVATTPLTADATSDVCGADDTIPRTSNRTVSVAPVLMARPAPARVMCNGGGGGEAATSGGEREVDVMVSGGEWV